MVFQTEISSSSGRQNGEARPMFARETKFCTVALNICGLSVWKLLYVTFLAPVIGGGFQISVYPGPILLLLLYHYNHPSSFQNISQFTYSIYSLAPSHIGCVLLTLFSIHIQFSTDGFHYCSSSLFSYGLHYHSYSAISDI